LITAQERLAFLESTELDRSAPMFKNVAEVAQRLGLGEIERALLEFGVGIRLVESVASWFESARTRRRDLYAVIARALDVSEQEVHRALSPTSSLIQARLIQLPDDRREAEFGAPEWLAELFARHHADCQDLFSSLFREAPPSSLSADDFPHVRGPLDIATSLLRHALANRTPGLNVLLYGPPAAGKTELARVLAQSSGVRLLEVSVEGGEGEALSGHGRFDAYALTQRVLRGSHNEIILFDEVEEALETRRMPSMLRMFEGFAAGARDKGWINRTLEDNPRPAIWIANSVDRLDAALLRRFTFVIELRTPPASVRRSIIERYTKDLAVSDVWKDEVAQDTRLAPGHIEAAARAARMVDANCTPVEDVLTAVLMAGWSAQGLAQRPMPVHKDLGAWDPDLVNASCDLEHVAKSAAVAKRGAILLYGPPGTGKSAFAKYLAEALHRELLVRRASDLLSKWVGESEQNLAAMFVEARATGAVLLLDEADGFLADRAGAMHRWELTQVNELLVQMEAYDGIFLCATNLVDALDAAAFRRFALKIRLDPLRPDQRWKLYCATLTRFGLEADERMRPAVDRVGDLTPGDFAAVVRGAALKGPPDCALALLKSLEEERKMKPGKGREEIGFASRLVRGGQTATPP
jgi:SpoVK/Ycf46/Vps4 family AAA+-type ATPase